MRFFLRQTFALFTGQTVVVIVALAGPLPITAHRPLFQGLWTGGGGGVYSPAAAIGVSTWGISHYRERSCMCVPTTCKK